jgi:hypothetical protein
LMSTDVSSPPEYARTIFSVIVCSPIFETELFPLPQGRRF